MSNYGLIKANSKAQRVDTIEDLFRINSWLSGKNLPSILCYGPSIRALENTVALGLERIESKVGMPKLVRGLSFYHSIIPEIKDKERHKFNWHNDVIYREQFKNKYQ